MRATVETFRSVRNSRSRATVVFLCINRYCRRASKSVPHPNLRQISRHLRRYVPCSQLSTNQLGIGQPVAIATNRRAQDRNRQKTCYSISDPLKRRAPRIRKLPFRMRRRYDRSPSREFRLAHVGDECHFKRTRYDVAPLISTRYHDRRSQLT